MPLGIVTAFKIGNHTFGGGGTGIMKKALRALLRNLEAIEEDYDGLGETNVREHMQEHVLHALLRPTPGYVPTGAYGLDPEANHKVAAALAAFCKAAEKEAQQQGLTTYEQRVAAFQDHEVATANGSNFEDFFGVIELPSPIQFATAEAISKKVKLAQHGYVFDRAGSLNDLLQALNLQGNWQWQFVPMGAEDPHLVAQPEAQARVRIREEYEGMDADGTVHPPEHGFLAVLEATPDRIDPIDTAFRSALSLASATNVLAQTSFWW